MDALSSIKAKAFDNLMNLLRGRQRLVGVIGGRRDSSAGIYVCEEVCTYEWTIRVDGSKDLEEALLNEARTDLEKEP